MTRFSKDEVFFHTKKPFVSYLHAKFHNPRRAGGCTSVPYLIVTILMPKPDAPELGTDGLDAPVLGDPRTRCAVLGTED